MSTDTTYNGWTNYETWAVKLWIDNEQGSQEYWLETAKECMEHDERGAIRNLADTLKEWHEEAAPEIPNSVFSDLMNAALGSVNWAEIARAFIDEVKENEEYENSK